MFGNSLEMGTWWPTMVQLLEPFGQWLSVMGSIAIAGYLLTRIRSAVTGERVEKEK